MKKAFSIILILLIAFSSSSCSIIEKLFLKKNGSGTYYVTVDMSVLGATIKQLSDTDDSLYELLANTPSVDSLKKIGFITEELFNVEKTIEKEKLTATIKFDFSDVKFLNEFFINLYKIDSTNLHGDEIKKLEKLFSSSKRVFERNDYDLLGQIVLANDNKGEASLFTKKMLVPGTFHEFTMEFENRIRKFSNEDYEMTTPNSVTLKRYYLNKEDEKKQIQVSVKIK